MVRNVWNTLRMANFENNNNNVQSTSPSILLHFIAGDVLRLALEFVDIITSH